MHNLNSGVTHRYPRGFVGKTPQEKVEKEPVKAQQPTYDQDMWRRKAKIVPSNEQVNRLYDRYTKTRGNTVAFSYKKAILVAAIHAFGTSNFYHWYEAQMKSPEVSEVHSQFLDDTMNFIQTGQRRLPLITWGSLIESNNVGGGCDDQLSAVAKEFFFNQWNGKISECRTNLLDVINSWVCQPNGINDLLGTLHLLFGEQP